MKVLETLENIKIKNPVVTVGIFDGVHKGHQKIIARINQVAREMNGESVLLTLWPHPRMVLNKDNTDLQFLTSPGEKECLIELHGINNLIRLEFTRAFASMTSNEFIEQVLVKKIGLKYLIVGFNHQFGKDRQGSFEILKKEAANYHFGVEKLPPFLDNDVKLSSSYIRKLLQDGKVKAANDFLGYHYFLQGMVTGGSRIGRKIGFPTANIEPIMKTKLVPKDGVYAVKVEVRGKKYNGMLNIGFRPTINTPDPRRTQEVHIFNFNDEIYGEKIMIAYIKRIRDEVKFNTIDELKSQLTSDMEASLAALNT